MAQVLVLVDHLDGAVRKTTIELLTIARRLGRPAAVFVGDGFENAAGTLAEYGADDVWLVGGEGLEDHLVLPKVEALAAAIGQARASEPPAAVLIPSSSEGKEIAGRLAVRLGSGVITDAVDVAAGPDGAVVTTQSAFAGSFAVTARVTRGIPVITVKPNSAEPAPDPAMVMVNPFWPARRENIR